MRLIRFVVLYTALTVGANAAMAETARPDMAAIDALRTGDMAKLVLSEAPEMAPDGLLLDATDGEHHLSDWKGTFLLVNFWATWCAPCRAELGALDRLQAELGGDGFEVVTVATGRNPVAAIEKLFAGEGISHLPILRDPDQTFAHDMGVLGLPVSVLIDSEGREVARLIGDAAWDSPEAKALLTAFKKEK